MNIRVYDIKSMIEKEMEGKTTHRDDEMTIIEGKRGYVVSDYEAIHQVKDLATDSYRIYTVPKEEGGIFLLPTGYVPIPIQAIMEKAPCKEMEFHSFFSKQDYNARCQNNFRILLESLDEIGFDWNGKEKEVPKSLDEKMKGAKERQEKKAVVESKQRNDEISL